MYCSLIQTTIRKRSLFDITLDIHYFITWQFLMRQIFQIPLCTGHKRSETFFVFCCISTNLLRKH